MTTDPIKKTVRFAATPEKLFDAFTVKEELEGWFAGTATVWAESGGSWHYTFPPQWLRPVHS